MGTRSKISNEYQGMNWIRKEKRLAIYLRDGLACVYCHATIEDGAIFTLDHLVPFSQNGGNEATNLVTACRTCNSRRGDRPLQQFVDAVAAYLNVDAYILAEKVLEQAVKPLNIAEAKDIIARRGWVGITRPV